MNGVYDAKGYFWPVKPPTCEDLDVVAHTIARRVSRFLEKAGYLVRDAESAYLDLMQDEEDAMGAIVGASITYRLAFGPNAGRKALTLQTVPVRTEQRKGDDLVSQQAGFSLHAGIACKSHQRKKLERLCRYITRPAIAERRLSLANNGNVVIALKTPYNILLVRCSTCTTTFEKLFILFLSISISSKFLNIGGTTGTNR